jgi:hypothetical protein
MGVDGWLGVDGHVTNVARRYASRRGHDERRQGITRTTRARACKAALTRRERAALRAASSQRGRGGAEHAARAAGLRRGPTAPSRGRATPGMRRAAPAPTAVSWAGRERMAKHGGRHARVGDRAGGGESRRGWGHASAPPRRAGAPGPGTEQAGEAAQRAGLSRARRSIAAVPSRGRAGAGQGGGRGLRQGGDQARVRATAELVGVGGTARPRRVGGAARAGPGPSASGTTTGEGEGGEGGEGRGLPRRARAAPKRERGRAGETCARGRGERERFWGEGRLTGRAHREKAAAVLTTVRTARMGGRGELGPRLGRRAGPRRGGGGGASWAARPRPDRRAGWAARRGGRKGEGKGFSLFHFLFSSKLHPKILFANHSNTSKKIMVRHDATIKEIFLGFTYTRSRAKSR